MTFICSAIWFLTNPVCIAMYSLFKKHIDLLPSFIQACTGHSVIDFDIKSSIWQKSMASKCHLTLGSRNLVNVWQKSAIMAEWCLCLQMLIYIKILTYEIHYFSIYNLQYYKIEWKSTTLHKSLCLAPSSLLPTFKN